MGMRFEKEIFGELMETIHEVSREDTESLKDNLERANRIFITGAGRAGLMMFCYAFDAPGLSSQCGGRDCDYQHSAGRSVGDWLRIGRDRGKYHIGKAGKGQRYSGYSDLHQQRIDPGAACGHYSDTEGAYETS